MIGNYWDWLFPFFHDQFKIYFTNEFFSWKNSVGLGNPLSYVSSFWTNFMKGCLFFFPLKSEYIFILVFLVLMILFVCGACKIISRLRSKNKSIVVLLLFATLFSPAFFYKLMAGHSDYFISLIIFSGLIYFLLYKYQSSLKSAVIEGLLLALVGAQIQFFVFGSIVLIIYHLLNRQKFQVKYFILSLVIAFLINLPWLSNFILGINTLSSTSQGATSMLFNGSAFASPLRILTMTFSNATNIQYVYAKPWLAYFGIFSVITIVSSIFYLLVVHRNIADKEYAAKRAEEDRATLFFIINWIVFSVLGTGYFQKLPIPLVRIFYPMFRESGHFAPIIILFEVLVLAKTWSYLHGQIANSVNNFLAKNQKKQYTCENIEQSMSYKIIGYFLTFYLMGFIAVNAYYMVRYLPRVDFAKAREKFQQFEDFGQTDSSMYRVLTYPFWNQYGFLDTPNVYKNGKLLNNSGWDSFMAFSGKDSISNYQAGGQGIYDTLQYRLLKTLDITELEKKNVRYIYDFSEIYLSNWDKYTSPDTYDNDISLIKNDPEFFNKLMTANPGKIEKVSDKIYQLKNTKPRIFVQNTDSSTKGAGEPQLYFQRINPTKYKISIKGLKDEANLNFLENYHKDWKLYLVEPSEKSETNLYNQIPNWCIKKDQQNNGATECLGNQKFTEWDELKYLSTKRVADGTHTKYSDYGNKWTVSKEELLKQVQDNRGMDQNDKDENIKTNSDGSVNMELVLYFQPQTPFYIALILSLLTIFGTGGYLIYAKVRRKK